jgi:WD40 repeat protein
MAVYKIFISSPGDVGRERYLAEQVIRRVAVEFQNRVEVQPYFWEYEPMESTRDYQDNIPLTSDFDLVICILWKRLGSPLSVKHQRPDGGRWRSGTEFELVTAVESKKARGVPDIFIFKNDTKPTFEADEEGSGAKTEADLAQWKTLIAFIKEWCEREQDGQRVFTAALNRYQALDQFEQVLEKLLVGKLNERFPPAPNDPGSELSSSRPPAPTWTAGSPFRGLEAFQFIHAPVFCGRTHAIGEVLDRLRRKAAQGRPFVLILGASGSGKSSLAMAGVLPLLVKPGTIEGVGLWRRVIFRPGGQTEVGDLFGRLATALVRRQQEGEGLPELISGRTTVEQLAADLRADPKAAALLVRSALDQVAVLYRAAEAQKLRGWMTESQAENRAADVERYGRLLADLTPREARLALVIDQAEELFTSDDLNRRPDLRKDFSVALDALAASGVVFVLATLRSDFYSQIQQLPALVDLKEADGQFDLLPAQPAQIAQMIRQPAIAAGLTFQKDPQTEEGLGLDEVLADQVKAEPRLLPLLEFALDELYKQRSAKGELTFEAYRVHLDGSIVRALAKRADATLEELPKLSRDAFPSVMRRLATMVDDTAAGFVKGQQVDVIQNSSSGPAFQRQRVRYDQLTAYPPGAKGLVDAFVAARLLVVETGKTDEQRAEVTVAHEALFEHWAALKNLLLVERNDLILPRARVAASHKRWLAENRTRDFLLPPGKQLSEAEQLLAEYGEELTPELKAYVAASMAQAHAEQEGRQRLMIGALLVFAVLFVAATAAAFFGFWQKRQAEKQLLMATHELYATALENAEKYRSSGSFDLAIDELNKQKPTGQAIDLREFAWRVLWRLYNNHRYVIFVSGETKSIDISPDGTQLAIANDSSLITLWDLTNGRRIGSIEDPEETFDAAVFVAGGAQIVSRGSKNGYMNTKKARLWDLKDLRKPGPVIGNGLQTPIFTENGLQRTFSRDRWTLIAYARDDWLKDVKLIDIKTGSETGIDPGGQFSDVINCFAVSPDDRIAALVGNRNEVLLVDARTGRNIRRRDLPENWRSTWQEVEFTPDGALLIVGIAKDGRYEILVWGPATMEEGPVLRGPKVDQHEFIAVRASQDGGKIALLVGNSRLSRQKSLLTVWDRSTAKELYELGEEQTGFATAMQFSPAADVLATGGRNHQLRLWDATNGRLRNVLGVHHGSLTRDGEKEREHRAQGVLFSRHSAEGAGISRLLFSSDGHTIVTASGEFGAVRIWDANVDPDSQGLPLPQDHQKAVAFSPDGKYVVTGNSDGVVAWWESGKGTRVSNVIGHRAPVLGLAFSPTGEVLASASADGVVKLWRATDFREERTFAGTSGTSSLMFSADGHLLAAIGNKETLLWNVKSRKWLYTLLGTAPVAFSGDGGVFATTIASNNSKQIVAWDLPSGRRKSTITIPCSSGGLFFGGDERGCPDSLSLSPDAATLLTMRSSVGPPGSSRDVEGRLWSMETGKDYARLTGYTDDGDAVSAFSPDGKTIATSGVGGAVNLWDPYTGRLLLTLSDPSMGHTSSLRFWRNGSALVVVHESDARLWRATSETR